MRFRSLSISNFRAVRLFEVDELDDFVVIAGQNGSGKSCLLDAIRLLKSVYGGYSQDEHMQWFNEFAINPQDRSQMRAVFRDPEKPVKISATIEFSPSEREYLVENAADLAWPIAWQRVTGQRMDHWTFNRMAIATQLGHFRPAVEEQVGSIAEALSVELKSPTQKIAVALHPEGNIEIENSTPAIVSFQAYEPDDLGVIEFHSASRAYPRQPLQGINLDDRAFTDQRRQFSLYNWEQKYVNVRSELATAYVKGLIAGQVEHSEHHDLNETLKELFRTFFPDKEYLGVTPTPSGALQFPVRLPGGETHDIDELSSGEKEILYGYLRLRNSTPKSSVILLDEPELHLNPSLLQGFADFYYRNLGVSQGNQIWLVTHSDTLLRQAIGNSNYGVYHMLTATTSTGNQASEILLDDDLERVVVELVGDLAAYRPHAKVVVLEGTTDDGFDEQMVRRLFPDVAKRVNLVSAGSKRRVRDLYEILDRVASTSGLSNRFFAIVDKDTEHYEPPDGAATEYMWNVYHIENYLLDARSIRDACKALAGSDLFDSDEKVMDALRVEAERLIEPLVFQRVQKQVNDEIVQAIRIGGDHESGNVSRAMIPSINSTLARMDAFRDRFDEGWLENRAGEIRFDLKQVVATGQWTKQFPGRQVLSRFAGSNLKVGYVPFRNLVLEQLASREARPEGMDDVLQRVLSR